MIGLLVVVVVAAAVVARDLTGPVSMLLVDLPISDGLLVSNCFLLVFCKMFACSLPGHVGN